MGKDLVTAYYNVDYEKNPKVIITLAGQETLGLWSLVLKSSLWEEKHARPLSLVARGFLYL